MNVVVVVMFCNVFLFVLLRWMCVGLIVLIRMWCMIEVLEGLCVFLVLE